VPFKTWVVGEEVLAADFNAYVQKQVVATFPNAAARTAAIPSPSAGMVTFLTDTNQMQYWTGSAWAGTSSVLWSVVTAGEQPGISTTLTDISGLTSPPISIPANRNIEVVVDVPFNKVNPGDAAGWIQLNVDVSGQPASGMDRYEDCLAPGFITMHASRIITVPAGSYTFTARAKTVAGYVNVHASFRTLYIKDLGST
jgi:hypothetical protein